MASPPRTEEGLLEREDPLGREDPQLREEIAASGREDPLPREDRVSPGREDSPRRDERGRETEREEDKGLIDRAKDKLRGF